MARHARKRAGRVRRPHIPILVAALGYFVDIYDLILFSIVRVPSLTALGLSGEALLESGVLLLNMQMAGMLVGGIAWGVMGDKRGRLSVLFGSIVLYSLANIANGFVHDVPTYAALRFIAGVGLAGELGAGITLVSEIMPKEFAATARRSSPASASSARSSPCWSATPSTGAPPTSSAA